MKKTIYLAMALSLLCACSKDHPAALDDNEIRFNASLSATKASDAGFADGDSFSLYAVERSGEEVLPLQVGGNFINNEKLTRSEGVFTPERSLYWGDNACDFYAVYPYIENISTVDALPLSVQTDQTGAGYEASDLLFAKAENWGRTDGAVNLAFEHLLSKLVVKVVKGEKFEGEIPDDIVAHIYNTNVEYTFNFNTGSVDKNPFGAKRTITMNKLGNERFEAVIVPQNIEKKTPLIELTMGGIAYLLDYSLSFRAGYCHTINLILNTSPDQEKIEISIDPSVDPMN